MASRFPLVVFAGLLGVMTSGVCRAASFDSVREGFWAVNSAAEPYAWNDPDRRRPGAGDTVRVLGHVVTVRQAESVGRLEFQGGELVLGAFPLELSGDSEWVAGTMTGRLVNRATLSFPGSGTRRLSGSAINHGGWTFDAGATLSIDRGIVVSNAPGAVIALAGGSTLLSSGSGSGDLTRVQNLGSLTKSGDGVAKIGAGIVLENAGLLTISGGTLVCEMPFVQRAGETRLSGGHLESTTSSSVLGGELSGAGEIRGAFMNGARLHPAPGVQGIRIEGAYAQGKSGTLVLDLTGAPDTDAFSRLTVTGALNLRGAVEVRLADGFSPEVGSVYPIVRGSVRVGRFTATDVIPLPGGRVAVPTYRADGVDLVVRTE